MMKIDDLLKRPGAWLDLGQETNIVISSRVRLARNLKDRLFPSRAKDDSLIGVWEEIDAILSKLKILRECISIPMDETSDTDKLILFERHLVSREHLEKGKGSGLVVREDERVSVMVNEEDHLRLQTLSAGLDLKGTWKHADQLDSAIEKEVPYAFSTQLGYLTACPTNVGTGMRASVMLHLPGLVLMNEMGPIIKGMSKIGLTVRGLWGEGTEAVGNMFQVSNQITLGEREEEIIAGLENIVREIVEHEKNARARLVESKETKLKDHVGRSLGILSHVHLLSSKEALQLLSGLRLGIEMGILENIKRDVVDELMILTQPAHLQKLEGKELNARERDEARASLVRSRISVH